MKKTLAIVLTLILAFTLAMPCFAAAGNTAAATGTQNNEEIKSGWVDFRRAELPYPIQNLKIEAPQNLTVELKNRADTGAPYFLLKWKNPANLNLFEACESGGFFYQLDWKIGNGKWSYETDGDLIHRNGLHDGTDYMTELEWSPLDVGESQAIDIKANTYSFRVRFTFDWIDEDGYEKSNYGPFSNIASIGVDAFRFEYKKASDWAKPELDKAVEYGLITEKIKDKMNGPISREEFAELAVRLYEKCTGKTASAGAMSAFADTDNPEIFKADELKIVNGTNLEKKLFSPKDLTNREQVAAMLFRAVNAVKPGADFSTAGSENFADSGQISGWALESVKFMSKHGFIKGSGGKFDPKGTCTREMAVLIVVRVYEAYSK